MVELLREALRKVLEKGTTFSELERKTSVHRASLLRFLRGERDLYFEAAGRLAKELGMTLKPQGRQRKCANQK